MSLDPPTYLNSLQNNIRARPIPWEGAVRAGTITDQDLRKIKSVDKVRREQRKKVVEENFAAYRSLLLGSNSEKSVLEAAAKRADVVQYILVLTSDLLNGTVSLEWLLKSFAEDTTDVPDFASELLNHPDPYRPFLPLLRYSANPEEPIPLLTSSVLSSLISAAHTKSPRPTKKTTDALPKLCQYLSSLTNSQDTGLQDIAVLEYSVVLRTKDSRELFWKQREETITPLLDILRAAVGAGKDSDSTLWSGATSVRSGEGGITSGVGIQLLYHVLLVFWLLSFEGALIGQQLNE